MSNPNVNLKKIGWILRVGMFGEFFGHGIFAIGFIKFFTFNPKANFVAMLTAMTGGLIVGDLAKNIMVFIGFIDVIIAFMALIFPFRLMLIWASIWGFLTAVARPVGGDPIWDFVERWGNWAGPLALLYLRGFPKKLKDLFS